MKQLFITLFILSFLHANLFAQKSDSELLKKLVEKNILTQQEADEINTDEEAKKPTSSKIREAFNTPYIKFGGYAMLMYKYKDIPVGDEPRHKADPRLALVSMTGNFNNFKYFILTDFVSPRVYEINGEWAPSQAFKVKGGVMKVPYSFENQISLTDLETISNTRSISSLIGMAGDVQEKQTKVNSTGRDMGLQVYGNLLQKNDHELIQYAAGIFQGTGIQFFSKDSHQDFVASAALRPIKNFRIGGAAYFGHANYIIDETLPTEKHTRNRWIASTDYKSESFYARAEWIWAKDGDVKKEGLHATAQYYIVPKKLNVVAKVDYFNRDKDTGSKVVDYLAAVNYYFYPACRFQVNYTYSDYSTAWGAQNTNAIVGQVQVVF